MKSPLFLTTCFLLLCFANTARAQKAKLIFHGIDTNRSNRPVSPSYFIGSIHPRERPKLSNDCHAAFGIIEFKVQESRKLDSVTVTGSIEDPMKEVYRKKVEASAQYWECRDCRKGGYWVSVPVFHNFQAGCRTGDPSKKDNTLFFEASDYYFHLFQKWRSKNDLDAIFTAPRRLILDPVYAGSVR